MKPLNWIRKRFGWVASASVWLWIVAWAAFCLLASAAVWIGDPEWLTGGESGSTTIRNLFLVLAALVALPLAIWRSMIAERQANAAYKQAETAQRQSETAQRGLLNERYQKGAEMLGSPILSVRLGGIYALERLAAEHPDEYHIPINKLFCAFVRHPTVDETGSPDPQKLEKKPKLRADLQAAMEAIGNRSEYGISLENSDESILDFRSANLAGLHLHHVNLSGAYFHHADLSEAGITNSDLSATQLALNSLSGAAFTNPTSATRGLRGC